jgi:Protein of unknown function (DUF3365)
MPAREGAATVEFGLEGNVRSIPVLATLAIGALLLSGAQAVEPDPHLASARAAAKELGESLKRELMAAIAARGPKAAIESCKTIAPALAETTGAGRGMQIRRTALRLRNPANAPDVWERAVLEDFAAQVKAGADAAKLEHAETVTDASGASTFRYMKAIPMGAVPCLTCHGAPEPALKAEIMRLYPQDQATGFAPGDLRGAFSVSAQVAAPVRPPAPAPAAPPAP